MLFACYIVTADLLIPHKQVFFCFVLSKELELRLNRDDCQRRSDHFKSDSSQQNTEDKPEQFVVLT